MSYPNVLEKTLLELESNGMWFRTCSCNEAFTLSYGKLKSVTTKTEWYPPHCLPCHWGYESGAKFVSNYPEKEEGIERYVVFVGEHFGAIHFYHVSKSGLSPRYKWGSSNEVISSDETLELRKKIHKIYEDTPITKKIILAETYSSVLTPRLLQELEEKFNLSDGTWYMLPSDCYCCS